MDVCSCSCWYEEGCCWSRWKKISSPVQDSVDEDEGEGAGSEDALWFAFGSGARLGFFRSMFSVFRLSCLEGVGGKAAEIARSRSDVGVASWEAAGRGRMESGRMRCVGGEVIFDGEEECQERAVAASRSARGSSSLEERLVDDGEGLRWFSSKSAIEGSGLRSGTVDCPEPVLMCPQSMASSSLPLPSDVVESVLEEDSLSSCSIPLGFVMVSLLGLHLNACLKWLKTFIASSGIPGGVTTSFPGRWVGGGLAAKILDICEAYEGRGGVLLNAPNFCRLRAVFEGDLMRDACRS